MPKTKIKATEVKRGMILSPTTFQRKAGEVVRSVTEHEDLVIIHFANGVDERFAPEDKLTQLED